MSAKDQGVTLDRYMFIPRTLIFLTHGEKVLLLKGSPKKRLWANKYNGVGGHIEPGEDILSAARREIIEETGLYPTDLWLCATITIDTGQNPGICIFVLRGECKEEGQCPSSEGTLEWISYTEIDQLPLVEDLYILLPKILAMRKERPPLSVHYSYGTAGELIIVFG
jgi:8-oxo-dGTP diphosphatase